MLINERLKAQNDGEAWLDCNARGRVHHWVYEFTGQVGSYYRCNRCPVSTVVPRSKSWQHGGSTGSPVPPPPFLGRPTAIGRRR